MSQEPAPDQTPPGRMRTFRVSTGLAYLVLPDEDARAADPANAAQAIDADERVTD